LVAPLALLLASAVLADAARAQCAQPPEAGTWGHPAPAAVDFSRVRIRFVCGAERPWFVLVRGTCDRAACDWPEIGAQQVASGQIYAAYRRAAVRYHFYARASSGEANRLQVYTWIPATPGRPDRGWTAVYRRLP
jgi:hypothetical protein